MKITIGGFDNSGIIDNRGGVISINRPHKTEITPTVNENRQNNAPLLFISHSTEDQKFADALVSLLEGIDGVDESNLFCSSHPKYGLKVGDDFNKKLQTYISQRKLLMICVLSPRYYSSPFALNEMGAAWGKNAEHILILTCDMNISQMKGVFDNREIVIKVNSEDACSLLDGIKTRIIDFLNLNEPNTDNWENRKLTFINTVSDMHESVQQSTH